MIYCISDIHGEYDKFMQMLDLIGLREEDTLYVLGDVFERVHHPIRTLLKIMEMPNAFFILGNHELMALEVMKDGFEQVVTSDLADLDDNTVEKLMLWYQNGCAPTVSEFRELDRETQRAVHEYLLDSLAYEQLEVNGQKFLLVHSGIMNFDPECDISEYALYELVWARPDFDKPYFEDVITVLGHTPTPLIDGCDTPGKIFRKNNFVVIDCGASMGGSLGCLCLDTMEEFYC
ncbi:MAG: metallophosphoesterase [Ruminococcus sp.]|nr:metallophosphoesterase [Ruminococcus sp.]